MPALSARIAVTTGSNPGGGYALAGDPPEMLAQIRSFADLGVEHLALVFEAADPSALVRAVERFDREVVRADGA
jgi:hypothetical protein